VHILLLGGNGLIGRGIVTRLIATGHDVTVFHRGDASVVAGARAWRGDRNSRTDLAAVRDSARFDAVIDMVCFTGEQAALAAEVFDGAVPQWIHCSTVDVYPKGIGPYPLRKDAKRHARASFPYAVGKLEAERRLETVTGIAFDVTVIRPAATYLDSAVAPLGSFGLLLERMRAGLRILLPEGGTSIWVSAHRDDVAAALVGAIGNPRAHNQAYLVAGEELLTWREYWRTIGRAIDVEPVFVSVSAQALERIGGEDASRCLETFRHHNIFDCAEAHRDLAYRYRVTWAAGVAGFDLAPRDVDESEREGYARLLEAAGEAGA
jgi:nucleoside-diphosphate-sugar epimerase